MRFLSGNAHEGRRSSRADAAPAQPSIRGDFAERETGEHREQQQEKGDEGRRDALDQVRDVAHHGSACCGDDVGDDDHGRVDSGVVPACARRLQGSVRREQRGCDADKNCENDGSADTSHRLTLTPALTDPHAVCG